ncbi:MAG: hypothetical protein OEW89_06270 [Gammaproteobacteria bacterium]|nr:hypothetical protein [Gammaproteobacteria bacterium]
MLETPSYKVIDKVGMPHVIDFICRKLKDYDTRQLEWIKLLALNKNHLLHGCCTYPQREHRGSQNFKTGYRIRASVNIEMAPPFKFEHWARIPSSNYKQGWYSGAKAFLFDDLEECAIHTLAHECFHYLSHSKQLKHKNTEANANWWADQWLGEFHNLRMEINTV